MVRGGAGRMEVDSGHVAGPSREGEDRDRAVRWRERWVGEPAAAIRGAQINRKVSISATQIRQCTKTDQGAEADNQGKACKRSRTFHHRISFATHGHNK